MVSLDDGERMKRMEMMRMMMDGSFDCDLLPNYVASIRSSKRYCRESRLEESTKEFPRHAY